MIFTQTQRAHTQNRKTFSHKCRDTIQRILRTPKNGATCQEDTRLALMREQTKPNQRFVYAPPAPPLQPTPMLAVSGDTPLPVLHHIVQYYPHLRKWVIANPQADAALLETISQLGGPDVKRCLTILLRSLEQR